MRMRPKATLCYFKCPSPVIIIIVQITDYSLTRFSNISIKSAYTSFINKQTFDKNKIPTKNVNKNKQITL
jgi:hypothetical protein